MFLTYLDYFRDRLVDKLESLDERELRTNRIASKWTPIELVMHLRHVQRRWLEWGFEGLDVGDPWADRRDDRWFVAPDASLAEVGMSGPRWDGQDPPPLERILFHLLQEYARHVGHLDIVTELAVGDIGE